MELCFLGGAKAGEFLKTYDGQKNDLYIFGFEGLGEVCYEQELKGETRRFEDVAMLSKKASAIVVGGCITNTRGHKRKSVLVAENGRLLGVSDCTHTVEKEISCGAALRVYETQKGRMGVIVAEDLRCLETPQALAACGSDFLVCILGAIHTSMPLVLARAYAYTLGLPVILSADGYAAVVHERGEVQIATSQFPFYTSFSPRGEYHLMQIRRRGIFLEKL